MGLKYDHIAGEGTLAVPCDPGLWGAEQVSLRYRVWWDGKEPRDLSRELAAIRSRYRRAYGRLLETILAIYRRLPGWDVWIGEKKGFERLDLSRKEELHPYMGLPDLEAVRYEGRSLWGLTFGGGSCKLSIEHGLCAVFEGETLALLVDYTDFPNILEWWEEYRSHNLLTQLEDDK